VSGEPLRQPLASGSVAGFDQTFRAPKSVSVLFAIADEAREPISTAREWGRNGTLPRVKLGRHVRYIRRHVEAAILDAEQR
jgi:hypothetical protein